MSLSGDHNHDFDPSLTSLRRRRLTLVEGALLTGLLGLIPAICCPQFLISEQDHRRESCETYLRIINQAVRCWGAASGTRAADTYHLNDAGLLLHLRGRALPACEAGGSYIAGATYADLVTCSLPDH